MSKTTLLPRYYSVSQAAAVWGVSVSTMRRKIAAGEIHAVRLGSKLIRIPVDQLEAAGTVIPSVDSF